MADVRGTEQIEGRNPVWEALRAGRPLQRIWVARGPVAGSLLPILALAREQGVPVSEVEREQLDRLSQTRQHQGVIAVAAVRAYAELEDLFAAAEQRFEAPLFLLLDGIEDPQNLGSLLRSADGAGFHGVIIPERRAAGLGPTVAKASAGAVEHVPVVRVTNLTRTVEELKERGLWIVGAHHEADRLYTDSVWNGPIGLIIGSEGRGIGPNLRKHCDFLVRLPMRGRVNSLNAAIAGAILMYEALRQRTQ